jgi:hypothetical protein
MCYFFCTIHCVGNTVKQLGLFLSLLYCELTNFMYLWATDVDLCYDGILWMQVIAYLKKNVSKNIVGGKQYRGIVMFV